MSENGYIAFDSIGRRGNTEAVLCHTNNQSCCAKGQAIPGDWYFPNGTAVESYTTNSERLGTSHPFFARNRGTNPSVVRLYHNSHPSSNAIAEERGCFSCKIPDAAGNLQTLHVNICTLLPD